MVRGVVRGLYARAWSPLPTATGPVEDAVGDCASNNPMLSTLTAALSGKLNPNVNLVDTLNNGQFTVFAPVDDAFASFHRRPSTRSRVAPGQLSPQPVGDTHKTVQGADLTVSGSGDNLTVDNASVVCGGVQTANATVYLIDTVLTPPAG